MMTVLPDHQIEWVVEKYNVIEPYNPAQLQPASYDVLLGNTFKTMMLPTWAEEKGYSPAKWIDPYNQEQLDGLYESHKLKDGEPFILDSFQFALGVTKERVRIPPDLVCRIEGRSSVGRLGMGVHITAGFIDPGYVGNVTLEMFNFSPWPIAITPGMSVAQFCFMSTGQPARKPYAGRYQGNTEATHSRYGDK